MEQTQNEEAQEGGADAVIEWRRRRKKEGLFKANAVKREDFERGGGRTGARVI